MAKPTHPFLRDLKVGFISIGIEIVIVAALLAAAGLVVFVATTLLS